MCFICRVLIARALVRITMRLVLYGLGAALLAALIAPARAVLLAARDGLAALGPGGLAVAATAAVMLWFGVVLARRRER